MYKGYPICLQEDDETVSVLRLKLEPLDKIRLHEEVIPEAFRKICKAICEEKVLQDPIFIDEQSKVILDGMHRAAALLMLQSGECKNLFWDETSKQYTYVQCETCPGKFRNLQYILCCSLDYVESKAVTLKKWYRGVDFPFEEAVELLRSKYDMREQMGGDFSLLEDDAFAILTDGKKYFSLSADFDTILDKYMSLRDVETLIREKGGRISYCADEEAFSLLEQKEFSFLMITPTITRGDVQTFSKPGFPEKGEVFPPKSTRHRLAVRPLKINVPLRLLERGDYQFKQEQLKVFLRRKRKLTVTGRLEQYLEKHKILFGEPAELKEPLETPYLWICEFPFEFYEIKYDVDQFTEAVSSDLIQNGMELAYSALIRETNRLLLIVSGVNDEIKTEQRLVSLMNSYFPDYEIKNLFGSREDRSLVWIIPMEDCTPSRAYFERNERLLRKLVRIQSVIQSGKGGFQQVLTKADTGIMMTYSPRELLLLFAVHVLDGASRCKVFEYLHEDIDDHQNVFSGIEDLRKRGLLSLQNGDLRLTEKGTDVISRALTVTREITSLLRGLSTDKFAGFLKKIDSNVAHVIKPDGRKDEFHMGSIMESLVFTDMGWRKVVDAMDRVAEEVESVDFASSDELTSFVQRYLEEEYPLTNVPFRYDYFVNSRNHIFVKETRVTSLSRSHIEQDIERLIPEYLEMSASQKSQLSNMIYEGMRLLTIPLIKELYNKEQVVFEKSLLHIIEEFLVNQAVPILHRVRDTPPQAVIALLKETLEKAHTHLEMSEDLLQRMDLEFMKYYLAAMDELTESASVGLGKVPFFNVFGRLSQLALLAREPSATLQFFEPDNVHQFLGHMRGVFRRSTSLLDQWRNSYSTEERAILEEYRKDWKNHLRDVKALIRRCRRALP
ncbi:MAG: hypothetical protein HXS52_06710 [Theionarchaea archaeon]|nr:hypothetical protein [Theionarchaea archaeon]MBU7037605.1 hypothetical protein [Theionarchaea archaeon]